MYRRHHNVQLSIEEFHMPFGGTLEPENPTGFFLPNIKIQKTGAQDGGDTGIHARFSSRALGFVVRYINESLVL